MIRTVVAAVALALNTAPTQAQSHLTLTYQARTGHADAVKLTCNPTGGAHPEAAQACAVLRSTGADPGKIKPAHVMCMMLYAPVTAQITGTWHGGRLKWSHQYGNSCEMTRATGVLFKF
jgi:subtilisin inhibitor-like